MEKEDIVNYVMETPGNSNPAVLGSMLDSYSGGGGSGGGLPAITLNDWGQSLKVVIDPDNSTMKNVVPTQTITINVNSWVEINGSWEGVPLSGSYITSEGYEGVITWNGEEYKASGDLSLLDN